MRDTIPGLGGAVRLRRQALRLTLAELAGRVGTGVGTVSDIERDRRSPSARLFVALAEALGLSLDELIRRAKTQAGDGGAGRDPGGEEPAPRGRRRPRP
jgi:transcriptional regulator with XRE-family HTH domain